MKPDLRSERIRAQLNKAQEQCDRFKSGPMRRHFEERVRELEAEIADYGRSSFLMIDSETVHPE